MNLYLAKPKSSIDNMGLTKTFCDNRISRRLFVCLGVHQYGGLDLQIDLQRHPRTACLLESIWVTKLIPI